MITNRVDLLVTLVSDDDKKEVQKGFDKLVPKYQSELYTLYNILCDTKVLKSCGLSMPKSTSDGLSVQIELTKSDTTSVSKHIDDNDGVFKPFKKLKDVNIEYTKNKTGMLLVFTV